MIKAHIENIIGEKGKKGATSSFASSFITESILSPKCIRRFDLLYNNSLDFVEPFPIDFVT